jgi:2-hydroxychromene-2-carboxylate isomerase
MAQTPIEFWYEFASTYSYVAMEKVARSPAAFQYKPFLLGPVFAAQGMKDSPFNLFPVKGRYMVRDMERLCAALELPFKLPHDFPRGSLLATRVALAASLPDASTPAERESFLCAFSQRVYRANFAEDREIGEPSVVSEILTDLGKDAKSWLARAETPEVKQALRDQTARAQELGIFGAPTFLVRGELFWGSDRFDHALAWSERSA